MADFDLAEAIVKFASCTETNWNNFNLPIPQNVVIVTLDTRKFKRGDGIHLYSDLPDGPSIEGIENGNESVINSLTQLTAVNEDDIIVINNEIYSGSGTKLTTIMNRLGSIENKDVIQDANVVAIGNQFSMTTKGLVAGDNGKLAIVSNKKIAPGVLPETIVVETPQSPLHLISFDIYSDRACTKKVEELYYRSTYYAYIEASHDSVDIDNMTYGLTCDLNNNITITQVERGLFKIDITYPQNISNIIFNASLSYNADILNISKNVVLNNYTLKGMMLYGGTGIEYLYGSAIDSNGNIFFVGSTASEGTGGECIILKLDSNLNIVARKRFGGSGAEYFEAVAIDSNDNVFCVGRAIGYVYGLIAKFDNNLNLLSKKVIVGTNTYIKDIAIDSNDNIFCCGVVTWSTGYDACLIAKFDNNLNKILYKAYGYNEHDRFYGIAIDSNDNIFCSGHAVDGNTGGVTDALIVKFSNTLTLIYSKRYGGGGGYDSIAKMVIDSNNNIFAVGDSTSEGTGGYVCLILKFDNNLNLLMKKRYGGTSTDLATGVKIDSNGNPIVIGYTYSTGVGTTTYANAFVIKFDSSLNILFQKCFGGIYHDYFYGITIDSSDNIYLSGYTNSPNSTGNYDGLILKISTDMPSGYASPVTLTDFSISDISLTYEDSVLSYGNNILSLVDTTFTEYTYTMSVVDSNLTIKSDILYI